MFLNDYLTIMVAKSKTHTTNVFVHTGFSYRFSRVSYQTYLQTKIRYGKVIQKYWDEREDEK